MIWLTVYLWVTGGFEIAGLIMLLLESRNKPTLGFISVTKFIILWPVMFPFLFISTVSDMVRRKI